MPRLFGCFLWRLLLAVVCWHILHAGGSRTTTVEAFVWIPTICRLSTSRPSPSCGATTTSTVAGRSAVQAAAAKRASHQEDSQKQEDDYGNHFLHSLLTRFGFDKRLVTISAADLPVMAEVFPKKKSELCEIVAFHTKKSRGNNEPPTVQVRRCCLPNDEGKDKDSIVVVDIGQITTIWDTCGMMKNDDDSTSTTLGDQILQEWNQLPIGAMEESLDALYRSHVGRGRGGGGELTKKQIKKLVDSNLATEQEQQHAEHVLRQWIKAGKGCSRLVDSAVLRQSLYNDDSYKDTTTLLQQQAVASKLLAQDAEMGGRFKRMPCTFVDKTTTTPGGDLDSVSILNGGWLVLDQSVRAGSEARKFAQRVILQANNNNKSSMSDDTTIVTTISDERIVQRLECLAMGEEVLEEKDAEEKGLEVDVRETLKALGAPMTSVGARDVLVKIGRWSSDNTNQQQQQPWSAQVLNAAKWYCDQQLSLSQRTKEHAIKAGYYTDMTNIPFVCVDAKRTSFRDDAIGVRPRALTGRKVTAASKWEILVSIADVSDIYVETNTTNDNNNAAEQHLMALRKGAASRGVSRYDLPLGPLHLMPPVVLQALAFETVSPTNEDSEKKQSTTGYNRCVTVWLYIDERTGKLVDAGVERSVIAPPVALSYQMATQLLDGRVDVVKKDQLLLSRMRQVLAIAERGIMTWSLKRRQDSAAAQKREERHAIKELVATEQQRVVRYDNKLKQRNDGLLFQRSRGHKLVDASLDLYSYVLRGLLRRAKTPIPEQAGSGRARGGRVATAPLRRYVDGMAQRQVLAVLCGYGGPPMTRKECERISQEATNAYNAVANVRSTKQGHTRGSPPTSQKSAVAKLQLHLSGDGRKVVPAVGTGRDNEVVIQGAGTLANCKGIKGTLHPGEKILVKVNNINIEKGSVSVSRVS